jgi:hypothetical protein
MTFADHIRAWLDAPTSAIRRNGEPQTNRHLLNMSEIEVAARMPNGSIRQWLGGHRALSLVHQHNLSDALTRHGYVPQKNDADFL